MARFEFRLPDIGEGIAEAEIVAWHVKVGDTVSEDQQLADMMTDKATVEMESPVAGTVVELAGEVGDQVPIGSTLVVIEVAGDAPAAGESKDAREEVAEQAGGEDEDTLEAENPGVADAEGKTPAYETPSAPAKAGAVATEAAPPSRSTTARTSVRSPTAPSKRLPSRRTRCPSSRPMTLPRRRSPCPHPHPASSPKSPTRSRPEATSSPPPRSAPGRAISASTLAR